MISLESINVWIESILGPVSEPADEYDDNFDEDLNLSLPDEAISQEDSD